MRRLSSALVFGLVGALALTAWAAPRSKGKVIRVERSRGTAAVPRICSMQEDKAFCFGAEPQPNEMITVLDQTGVIAEARVVAATAFPGSIPCKIMWPVSVTLVRGDLKHVQGAPIGLIDGDVDPRRARMYPEDALPASPASNAGDKVVLAVDGNADGVPDLELTEYNCPGAQQGIGRGKCYAEWVRRGGSLTRVLELDISTCGF